MLSCNLHIITCNQFPSFLTGPDDYIPMTTVVTFDPQPDGLSIPQCVNIQVVNDEVLEIAEMFFVDLESSNPDVAVDISTNRAMVVIMNDDSMRHFLSRIIYNFIYSLLNLQALKLALSRQRTMCWKVRLIGKCALYWQMALKFQYQSR